jgi:hypothetical protein
VIFAGQQEVAMVRYRDAVRRRAQLAGQEPSFPQGPYIQPSALPPEPDFSGFTWDHQHQVWIEWRHGRPVHACVVHSE